MGATEKRISLNCKRVSDLSVTCDGFSPVLFYAVSARSEPFPCLSEPHGAEKRPVAQKIGASNPMAGRIIARKRKDGSIGYRTDVVIYQGGEIIHRETKTFDRRQAALVWKEKREAELERPGAIDAARHKTSGATLADAIDRYVSTSRKAIGRTKAQVLDAIKREPIADRVCSDIKSPDIVAFAEALAVGRKPQTVANYLSHLQSVFAIAGPAWGFGLDPNEMSAAFKVARRLGVTGKSESRERRPTREEIEAIFGFFRDRSIRRPLAAPMHKLVAFALYSTRRQEEITRIRWSDYEQNARRILVRDMKNPGDKVGNHVRCDLPDEAAAIIDAMPKVADEIFPYSATAIGAAFTRACHRLGIDDLHFHDLRHEGVSRLFELGWNIPHVAAVSGHRDWKSLKRYTHIDTRAGDKWAGDWWRA